jgi:hypothetical protein
MQENFQKVVLTRFKNLGECTIDGKNISEEIKNILSLDIEDDEKLIKVSDLIYDKVNSKFNNFKTIVDAFKLKKESIDKKESFGLKSTTSEISDYDFLNWISAISEIKSSDFHRLYVNYLK